MNIRLNGNYGNHTLENLGVQAAEAPHTDSCVDGSVRKSDAAADLSLLQNSGKGNGADA
jgi:hypothetical protein